MSSTNRDSRELLMSPARPVSMVSNVSSGGSTASTLVAEDGSVASGRRRFRFKPPVQQMETIQSVPDLLDVRSILSEANSDIHVPVITPSPASSPTVSVSSNSHIVSANSSSDGHNFWDEFIQPPEWEFSSSRASVAESDPLPARVSSPIFEFEWIGPRPRGTPVFRTAGNTPDIQLPQLPPPIASTGRDRVTYDTLDSGGSSEA
ncbi:hypothetical protein C0991_003681 [Blastosporella zonata]|nr:hypothetical protein C0991_003681 [Blastosporella zonata]